ncbi:MAG: sigma-70 family RNA polymerase sigma factor [Anaerolineales bacterium]|nr:sigma-70 family RNA polymerase sigma factor [Anaerolineales bacterium]
MMVHPDSDEALVKRLLPSANPDPNDRARAWAEWHARLGGPVVLKFIRTTNNTAEADEDILQDAMLTAYVEVERGRYEHRSGVPFAAYVKGIARNKIREARRRSRRWAPLDEAAYAPDDAAPRALEHALEGREARAALQQGLERLPSQRRQVLQRYLAGDSPAEIAKQMAITEALVRQHKHRGLRRLQQLSGLS